MRLGLDRHSLDGNGKAGKVRWGLLGQVKASFGMAGKASFGTLS